MNFEETPLQGSYVIKLSPINDNRGWFVRTFCRNEFEQHGLSGNWVQMNHSFTSTKGSVRGLHYQLPPFREIKLVRCIRGEAWDVIVDLRKESPTFLQTFGIKLSMDDMNMIYIPQGFAHGFQTLTDNCELIYLHSEFYQPGYEGGLRHCDPALKINWPLQVTNISDRDKNHPDIVSGFKGF